MVVIMMKVIMISWEKIGCDLNDKLVKMVVVLNSKP